MRATARVYSEVIGGAQARSIVASLNAARSFQSSKQCPDNTSDEYAGGSLRVVGVTSSGAASPPVVITLRCSNSLATNGTSLRYLAAVPEPLRRLLFPDPVLSTHS